jgi:hypothetical protein
MDIFLAILVGMAIGAVGAAGFCMGVWLKTKKGKPK